MDTKPPVFKEALELLEVDEWINTMEQKFCLLRMTEELKTEYAARAYWDLVVPSSHHLSRGDPNHLEPLHHHLSGKLYSSRCGGNEGWRIHEAVSGDQVCERVSPRFQ